MDITTLRNNINTEIVRNTEGKITAEKLRTLLLNITDLLITGITTED